MSDFPAMLDYQGKSVNPWWIHSSPNRFRISCKIWILSVCVICYFLYRLAQWHFGSIAFDVIFCHLTSMIYVIYLEQPVLILTKYRSFPRIAKHRKTHLRTDSYDCYCVRILGFRQDKRTSKFRPFSGRKFLPDTAGRPDNNLVSNPI